MERRTTRFKRLIPNALTLLRFAAVPVFVLLFRRAHAGGAVVAGLFFWGAALTDQLDGWLARRWHVESRFGRIADPLADRVMISVAALLLWRDGRLPWPGALIVIGRDVLLVVGYQLLAPRGVALEVSKLGKAGTWLLYAALTALIMWPRGTAWPLWVFWTGVGVAVAAAAQYVRRARQAIDDPASRRETALGGEPGPDAQAEVDPSSW
jgi:CDP-diacylglycerol--glycerol-3-phosphate 3-phosphatidyltransferase